MITELTVRMSRVELVLERNEENMARIAASLEKLVVIETQFADHRATLDRAFGAIKDLQGEIDDVREIVVEIRQKQPLIDYLLKAIGALVMAGVIGFFGWIVSKVNG